MQALNTRHGSPAGSTSMHSSPSRKSLCSSGLAFYQPLSDKHRRSWAADSGRVWCTGIGGIRPTWPIGLKWVFTFETPYIHTKPLCWRHKNQCGARFQLGNTSFIHSEQSGVVCITYSRYYRPSIAGVISAWIGRPRSVHTS